MQTAKRLEGIGEYYFYQKLRAIDQLNQQGKQIISLGIGSPDLPPHPEVIKVLQEESARLNVHAYQSYKGSPVLRKAFCNWYQQWYGVPLNPDTEILPLIGSKEGIMHICMTYLNEGDKVKLTIKFRGREITHPEIGLRILERLASEVAELSVVERKAKLEGKSMILILAPK